MAYEEIKSSGISDKTPGNILLGAGTIHRGLKFDKETGKWNFSESLIGATSGGNKLEIVPELKAIEVDGAWVKVKGLDVKTGETAKLEINLIELTPEIIKSAVIGQEVTTDFEGYNLIESKSQIVEGDYYENIAFVGKKLDGKPIIAILDNALCTSGLSIEGKNKDSAIPKYTFECSQAIDGDLTILPYHIYYPSVTATEINE